ncbi:MAG: LamG-like jellyroll fold domain-containing protein [Bacteroidota bacterium]
MLIIEVDENDNYLRSGCGILINTTFNTYDNVGAKRQFLILTANHMVKKIPLTAKVYISFDFEMASANLRQGINDGVRKFYKIPVEKVVVDEEADIALLRVTDAFVNSLDLSALNDMNGAFFNAYAAGWSLTPENPATNISHPQSDLKKIFVNPEKIAIEDGSDFDRLEAGFEVYKYGKYWTNSGKWDLLGTDDIEAGSSGSGLIDQNSNVAAVYICGNVGTSTFSSITNSWFYKDKDVGPQGLAGNGLIDYLDPLQTWINEVPGGYIKDLINPGNRKLALNVNANQVFEVQRAISVESLLDEFDADLRGELIENNDDFAGIRLLKNEDYPRVFLSIEDRDTHNLYYGVYATEEFGSVSETHFEDNEWEKPGPPSNFTGSVDWGVFSRDVDVPTNDYKARMVNGATRKLKNKRARLSDDNASIQKQTLNTIIRLFRENDGKSPASEVQAVRIPANVPINALELFQPESLADIWRSKKYRACKGNTNSGLFIDRLTVSQEAISKLIATGNNGGYLNLVNSFYQIDPVKTSYKSGTEVEDNYISFNIDVANRQTRTFHYKIWMDFFPVTDANNHYNFVSDPVRHEIELVAEGEMSSMVNRSVRMPDNDQLQMGPGDRKICRLRIAISYQDNIEQDGEYADGEVEDYLVEIRVPERKQPEAEIEIGFDGNLNDVALPASQSAFSGTGYGYDGGHRRLGSSSLRFGGDADFVSLDDNDLLLHKAFTARTISMWVYCESNTGLQDIYDEGDDVNGIGLRINNGNIELGVQNGNNIQKISGAIPVNQWVFVTGMFNNGKLSLYVDGTLAAEKTNMGFTSVPVHPGAAGLGATNGTNAFDQANNHFNGWVDELKIYNVALLESEIEFLSGSNAANTVPANAPAMVQKETPYFNTPATNKKHQPAASLIIYPNPSKGDVNLITEVKQAGHVTIQITDLLGRVVYEKKLSKVVAGFQQVALRNLQLGAATYIVRVVSNDYMQTGKLVVEN